MSATKEVRKNGVSTPVYLAFFHGIYNNLKKEKRKKSARSADV